jgi:hypothetical protein
MPDTDLIRQWPPTADDPLTMIALALAFLMSASLGGALASVAACLEDYLSTSRDREPRHESFGHAADESGGCDPNRQVIGFDKPRG